MRKTYRLLAGPRWWIEEGVLVCRNASGELVRMWRMFVGLYDMVTKNLRGRVPSMGHRSRKKREFWLTQAQQSCGSFWEWVGPRADNLDYKS